jgi:ubiquinone/menaquinone biosynthesis C-methylase UbiE
MSKIADQLYLLNDQYRNAANLKDRIQLHERFSTNTYNWHLWVFDQLKVMPQARILELGCGAGQLWVKNLDRIPAGWDVTLSDFSLGMLQDARENLGASGHPFAFEVIDAQAIPFDHASFDVVIANHMLYHVPDRAQALSEIQRVLKPDRRLYAATNGRNHLRELEELGRRFARDQELDEEVASKVAMSFNRPVAGGPAEEVPFTLESGYDELSQRFDTVVVHRYDSALRVTEVEPLIAYILSGNAKTVLVGDMLVQLTSFLEREIARQGAIVITKDAGLFEAW